MTSELLPQTVSFALRTDSGVPPYLQLVQQVRQAVRMGVLDVGDQLPTVKEVVAELAINPNTVLKAYRDLEREGLVRPRPGLGTFVVASLPRTDPAAQARFLASMTTWLRKARAAGLEQPELQRLMDLLHQLQICRNARGGVELELDHGSTLPLSS